MKLCIEVPDDLATSGWLLDIAYEGSEACWCSDKPEGLDKPSSFMYAIAMILNKQLPENEQQKFLDEQLTGEGEGPK